MLVTQPGATTHDVIELARTMQRMVHEQFGIVPQVECQMVGFKEKLL
jgi:UDP-N-acetylenolpyruvoylglucosamine reductase